MAKTSEQFQQVDVATWGLVALVCGALAVVSANISPVLPQKVVAAFHKTRAEGASIDQLRMQLVDLREETVRLRNENNSMLTRFALQEQNGQEAVERIGALEVSMPQIIEAMSTGSGIDLRTADSIDPLTTAAVGTTATSFEVDGGAIRVHQSPMQASAPVIDQPLPLQMAEVAPIATPDPDAFGVAIGSLVRPAEAAQGWKDLSDKVGPLLLGLAPLLAPDAGGEADDARIVAGPIDQLSQATALCARLERLSIACTPMPYSGTPLEL